MNSHFDNAGFVMCYAWLTLVHLDATQASEVVSLHIDFAHFATSYPDYPRNPACISREIFSTKRSDYRIEVQEYHKYRNPLLEINAIHQYFLQLENVYKVLKRRDYSWHAWKAETPRITILRWIIAFIYLSRTVWGLRYRDMSTTAAGCSAGSIIVVPCRVHMCSKCWVG